MYLFAGISHTALRKRDACSCYLEAYVIFTRVHFYLQMQALMAEAQASAAKAAAEREREAAQRALKAKNLPMMLRGAKLNITAQAPVKGNALQEAAAKAPPPQTSTPKGSDGANALARSGETSSLSMPLSSAGECSLTLLAQSS